MKQRIVIIASILSLAWVSGAFSQDAEPLEPSAPPDDVFDTSPAVAEEDLLRVTGGALISAVTGRPVEIRIVLPGADPDEVDLYVPELQGGVSMAENPTVVRRGNVVDLRISFVGNEPGRFIVDEILVVDGSELLEVEPILLEIAPRSGEDVPFQARWRVDTEEPAQSQSVPVVLEIVGADRYLYPDEISYRAPETGLFEEVAGIGEVTTRDIAGVTLYDIPVAAFLFTPATAGTVTLPAAVVRGAGIEADVQPITVEVSPLPSTVTDTNAVGRFAVHSRLDRTTIDEGEWVTLTIRIEGTGNLPVLDFPVISAPGFEETDRREESSFEADTTGLGGYSGYREVSVRLEHIDADGETEISVGDYSFFDSRSERVVRVPAEAHPVTVISPEGGEGEERRTPTFPLLTVTELTSPRWYRLGQISWVLYTMLIGPIVFGATALWSVRRNAPRSGAASRGALVGLVPFLLGLTLFPPIDRDRIERAAELVDEGREAVAAVLYELELQDNEWHAGIHYNRGVLGLKMERPVIATYHLRRAVRLAPEERLFRDALEAANAHFTLDEQVPIPVYPRPDYFVIAAIILWTAFWIVFASRRRLRNVLSLVGIVMLLVIVLGGLGWSWNIDRQRDGVVREAVHVRRIPDSSAVPWIGLSVAQAVRIDLEYQDFFLVETRTGITGWVPRSRILAPETKGLRR
ncbi:MAG: hypothetical protein ACLFR8_12035 [Alkalispirochaeta sp.]